MQLEPAPYYSDVAYGPGGGAAYWLKSSGTVRLRVGCWPLAGAKGTVLIFPGRTEYIEKYGQIAKGFADRGLAAVAIDWRGQGLSDRLLDDPLIGHVEHFPDYQKDVDALLRAARALKLPRPYFLLAHSMGGAIGLRAAMEGLPVKAAAFSGPMWAISLPVHLRAFAWGMAHLMPIIGQGHRLPPGTKLENHILADGYEDNLLTRDARQFEIMHEQLTRHPDLILGGPSFIWLREALLETHHLVERPAPNIPCLTYLGSEESIVDAGEIHRRMARWNNGTLEVIDQGRHEILMEDPKLVSRVLDEIVALFLATTRG
jgi:lysophospholipase